MNGYAEDGFVVPDGVYSDDSGSSEYSSSENDEFTEPDPAPPIIVEGHRRLAKKAEPRTVIVAPPPRSAPPLGLHRARTQRGG